MPSPYLPHSHPNPQRPSQLIHSSSTTLPSSRICSFGSCGASRTPWPRTMSSRVIWWRRFWHRWRYSVDSCGTSSAWRTNTLTTVVSSEPFGTFPLHRSIPTIRSSYWKWWTTRMVLSIGKFGLKSIETSTHPHPRFPISGTPKTTEPSTKRPKKTKSHCCRRSKVPCRTWMWTVRRSYERPTTCSSVVNVYKSVLIELAKIVVKTRLCRTLGTRIPHSSNKLDSEISAF